MITDCPKCGQPLMANTEYCPQCKQRHAGTTAGAFDGVPWWGWIFVVACGAIPVISLGGAIPAALGVGAAGACAAVSKKPDMSGALRLGACFGITMGAWFLFVLLIGGMAWMQR